MGIGDRETGNGAAQEDSRLIICSRFQIDLRNGERFVPLWPDWIGGPVKSIRSRNNNDYNCAMAHDAAYFRSKAEESRAMAANARSEEARSTLLSIAEQYERLAGQDEGRDNE